MVTKRIDSTRANRALLVAAARDLFATQGFANASMDELTASVGLTRGALYHAFGSKKGLLAAVVDEIDTEMANKAKRRAAHAQDPWARLMLEGKSYIEFALDQDVRRIVLLEGPAILGDPSTWPSQTACQKATEGIVADLIRAGIIKPVDVTAAARLLNGAALNGALWVAASDEPEKILPKAVEVFELMASGLRF